MANVNECLKTDRIERITNALKIKFLKMFEINSIHTLISKYVNVSTALQFKNIYILKNLPDNIYQETINN